MNTKPLNILIIKESLLKIYYVKNNFIVIKFCKRNNYSYVTRIVLSTNIFLKNYCTVNK